MKLAARIRSALLRPDVSIAHTFVRPPWGGSNQFLLALRDELRRGGYRVEANAISSRTRACIVNSYVFDPELLRALLHPGCRVVHRVDGPISVYRGWDDGTDARIAELNRELADVTVFQSRYSLERHRELGIELRDPVVIHNAVDPSIFHPPERREPLADRRVRLIATSWSDNPNKGAEVYRRLDDRLDRDRYELTFVGRSPVEFAHARTVPPVGSHEVAELLRAHDVFLFASLHESCSNALLEALSCGLPALYVDSGSNAELVRGGGIAFADEEELPGLLVRLVAEYDERQAAIEVPSLADVTQRYLAAMGLG